jgi:hypothetical protein
VSGRTVAIMQPTYLPWVGYFDLIDQCDLFVLLDCVQFDRRSWQQRNRIKTATGAAWLTVPVRAKGRRDQQIRDVEIDPGGDFPVKHVRALQHAYGRAPHASPYLEQLTGLLAGGATHLAALNTSVIEWVCRVAGIDTPLVRSSTLPAEGARVDRLLSICRAVGATRYISPRGSRGYIDADNRFDDAGIELRYQHYEHPTYRQLHGPFASHMCAPDLLLNEGTQALAILRSGRRALLTHEETAGGLAGAAAPA